MHDFPGFRTALLHQSDQLFSGGRADGLCIHKPDDLRKLWRPDLQLTGTNGIIIEYSQDLIHYPVGDPLRIPSVQAQRFLKKIRSFPLGSEQSRIITGQTVLTLEPPLFVLRQLRKLPAHSRKHLIRHHHRHQVRFTEKTVIHRVFLGTHFSQLPGIIIPFDGPLFHLPARFQFTSLPFDLRTDRLAHRVNGVDIFDLTFFPGKGYSLRGK